MRLDENTSKTDQALHGLGDAKRRSVTDGLSDHEPDQSKSRPITKGGWDGEWPLTVDHVVLWCKGSAVYIESEGVEYALNGVARHEGWPNFTPLWKKSSSGFGNVDISAMIEEGLRL